MKRLEAYLMEVADWIEDHPFAALVATQSGLLVAVILLSMGMRQ